MATFETYRERLHTTQIKLKAKEVERERALQLATAARLSSLESRVHPHFLFNTLNSVASLIHEDPKRAEAMVNQLAELLRFSLDSAQGGLVPLEHEMKIVEDYLAIEQARFGERLRYSIHLDARSGFTPIPPLAVQTLVENAVKYAVGPRIQGASIRITAQTDETRLRLEVRDDGPGFSCAAIPAGHGLNNLEERLAAIYGEAAKLQIDSSGAGTAVALFVPLRMAKAA
jgi:sensor histidine kinase YesM